MSAIITAIIPIRNRSGQRLENCLSSLRWQNTDPQQLHLLIVDFGSNEEHRQSIDDIALRYQTEVLKVDEYGVWNRSKALNYGIRHASTPYVFCTDVDMIFSPNFIQEMQLHLKEDAFLISRCNDLPESVGLHPWQQSDFGTLKQQSAIRETQGTGACQVALKSFFEEIRGYDEAFEFWGSEDTDLRRRARKYGLKEYCLSPKATMLHQWHPTTKNDRPWRKRLNTLRYYITAWQIKKNSKGWGGVYR
jgi:glycosyltransferase involved in cell wall biosynthesis